MDCIKQLIRQDLQNLMPYDVGLPHLAERLHANELPWSGGGDHSDSLNHYPAHRPAPLISQMARYYQVDMNQVLLTRGSNEGIDVMIRLFCTAYQEAIMICPPCFSMYRMVAQWQGAEVVSVPLVSNDFSLDVDNILLTWEPRIKIIFLCSPNNPTGNQIDLNLIEFLCESLLGKAMIVIDEAYIEFSQYSSMTHSISKYPNLVVLRTLSKAFGLAGARVGVLISNDFLMHALKTILPPYPLPSVSIDVAMKAFHPSALNTMRERVSQIVQARPGYFDCLQSLPAVQKIWLSEANFFLLQCRYPMIHQFIEHGISVRDMTGVTGIPNSLRITIGTPEQNKKCLRVLET